MAITLPTPQKATVLLPSTQVIPASEGGPLAGVMMLVYGEPGLGKTSFARDFHSASGQSLVFATDANWRSLPKRPNVVEIPTWDAFSRAVSALDLSKYDSVAIDTVTYLIDLCQDAVAKEFGVLHPSELEYGKGHAAVRVALSSVLSKLEAKARNVVYLAHESNFEFVSPSARRNKAGPAMPDATGRRIRGAVSLGARIEVEDKTGARFLNFNPTMSRYAKDTPELLKPLSGLHPLDGAALWNLLFPEN